MRASSVVKRQFTVLVASLRRCCQAATCCWRWPWLSMRSFKHWWAETLGSISAMMSHEPCLGVECHSILSDRRRAWAGGKASWRLCGLGCPLGGYRLWAPPGQMNFAPLLLGPVISSVPCALGRALRSRACPEACASPRSPRWERRFSLGPGAATRADHAPSSQTPRLVSTAGSVHAPPTTTAHHGGKSLGSIRQHPPGSARTQHVAQPAEHLPQIMLSLRSVLPHQSQIRSHESPLLITHITRVATALHTLLVYQSP